MPSVPSLPRIAVGLTLLINCCRVIVLSSPSRTVPLSGVFLRFVKAVLILLTSVCGVSPATCVMLPRL